ncbi:MAG: hypothetical protein AAFP77_22885 [Bacteroidota bacterium]
MLSIRFFALALLVVLLLDACSKCGPDVNLGELPLTANSRLFIPYADDVVLEFVDQDGEWHRVQSTLGREIETEELHIRFSCEENVWRTQYEYYESEMERIAFSDVDGEPVFSCRLRTSCEYDDNLTALAIIDHLRVDVSLFNKSYGAVKVITEEREGEVSDEFQERLLIRSRFVGDTLLYGRSFANVYSSEQGDQAFYYNQQQGALAFTIDEENYWVLAN